MNKVVTYAPAALDACALYRMFMPHLHTKNSKFFYTDKQTMDYDAIGDSSVVTVQRLAQEMNMNALMMFKKMGMKVAYDLDDDIYNVPGYNPAQKIIKAYRAGFEACARMCDVITVSTQPLRATLLKNMKLAKNQDVVVIPNAIDLDLFAPVDSYHEPVTIGWGGSPTHSKDTEAVFDLMPQILSVNPNVYLEIVGVKPDKIYDHPRVKLRPYVPVAQYAARLASWNWDIFVAPLQDNAFNRSKSGIKMLEAGALKCPILVSPVAPYKDVCRHQNDLGFLMCNTIQQWKTKLNVLIHEKAARQHYGNLLYDVVRKHYDIKVINQKREALFESL